MKVSSILFAGFFGVLVLGCLAFLIPADEAYQNRHRQYTLEEMELRTFEVPEFHYIKIQSTCKVRIFTSESESGYFSQSQPKDSAIVEPGYRLSGDTLILFKTFSYQTNEQQLYCGDLKKVIVDENGNAYFESAQKELDIEMMDGGRVVLESKQQAQKVEFSGENGSFICRSDSLKQCSLDIRNVKFECQSHNLEFLKVEASASNIRTRPAEKMELACDKETRFYSIN